MKFRLRKALIIAAAFSFLILAACSEPPAEEGGFTITLSSNENARAVYPPANTDDLKFTVKFNNTANGAEKTFSWEKSGSINGKIALGNYIVTMDVSLISDGSLYARGVAFDNPVAIGSGQNPIKVYVYDVNKAAPPVIRSKPSDLVTISIFSNVMINAYETSVSETSVIDGSMTTFKWFSNTTDSNSGGTLLPPGSSSTLLDLADGTAHTHLSLSPTTEGVTYYYAEVTNSGGGSATGPSSIKTKPFAVRAVNGKGTVDDPILVYDVASLQKVGSETDGWAMDAHYKQMDDIDLAPVPNWIPIGTTEHFTGSYDGNGFTISNLTINDTINIALNATTGNSLGLFGSIWANAVVKNIGLVNCSIVGASNPNVGCVGGVVGFNQFGTVQDCYVTGNVSGESSVGGVVGSSQGFSGTVTGGTVVGGGSVLNCYFTGSVSGSYYTGGVVGHVYNSSSSTSSVTKVQGCYATGDVSGVEHVGGVVGMSQSSIVQNCHATGSVSGEVWVGGVVGYAAGTGLVGGTVQYCYATGNVSGDDFVGGVVGYISSSTKVQYCYATGNVSSNYSASEEFYGCYVGGVVGSSNGGTVQNCYATGNVSGLDYAYVGGVVGYGRAQYCYATGNVSGGDYAYVGGVGRIQTPSNAVQNCVALNRDVSGTGSTYIGRVVGLTGGTYVSANNYYGRDDMRKNGSYTAGVTWTNIGFNNLDGESITSANWGSQSWWTDPDNWDTAAWDFTDVWEWGGSLPILRNMPDTATQNPAVLP
jgi:hypothetical protein